MHTWINYSCRVVRVHRRTYGPSIRRELPLLCVETPECALALFRYRLYVHAWSLVRPCVGRERGIGIDRCPCYRFHRDKNPEMSNNDDERQRLKPAATRVCSAYIVRRPRQDLPDFPCSEVPAPASGTKPTRAESGCVNFARGPGRQGYISGPLGNNNGGGFQSASSICTAVGWPARICPCPDAEFRCRTVFLVSPPIGHPRVQCYLVSLTNPLSPSLFPRMVDMASKAIIAPHIASARSVRGGGRTYVNPPHTPYFSST